MASSDFRTQNGGFLDVGETRTRLECYRAGVVASFVAVVAVVAAAILTELDRMKLRIYQMGRAMLIINPSKLITLYY